MVKKLTAETAATQVTQALKPAADFRVTTAHDPRSDPPVQQQMAPALKKSLGIDQS
jgi:hypothetical protein